MDNSKAPAKPSKNARLKALVRQAPLDAGVYLMRDAENQIIYIGKAKRLKNRLASYFNGRKDAKTRHLVSRIESIEWILAGSEYEALLLENTLIKKHSPRYNINLKDGKTYPSVRITREDFPRVFRTRRIIDDGSLYFGPFPSAELIDTYLELIRRLFPLRRCHVLRKRESPCMYYHIGRCPGPCAGKITREDYQAQVERVKSLLSGETERLASELRLKMAEASGALRFEEAARLRDAVDAIERFVGSSQTVDFDPEARDYVAWAAEGELIDFVVFQMRDGKLVGRDLFRTKIFGSDNEALQSFLMSYYDVDRLPPPKVFVMKDEALELVERYFVERLSARASLLPPSESRHEAAMNLAAQNAREDLAKRRREGGDLAALEELRQSLRLSSPPLRIEGFDIAQLGGRHTVASLVSFKNGLPDRKNYRHFKIKSLDGGIDDFGAIREAVARRYTRLVNEEAELPDLVLVDGGAGQVSAAKEIMDALGMDSALVGLAKRNEELYLPGRQAPLVLPLDSPALRLLVAVRDETHRFATGLNQKLRSSDIKFSILEAIPGVGAARARKLMRVFGSLKAIAGADAESIAQAGGLGVGLAETIRQALAAKGC